MNFYLQVENPDLMTREIDLGGTLVGEVDVIGVDLVGVEWDLEGDLEVVGLIAAEGQAMGGAHHLVEGRGALGSQIVEAQGVVEDIVHRVRVVDTAVVRVTLSKMVLPLEVMVSRMGTVVSRGVELVVVEVVQAMTGPTKWPTCSTTGVDNSNHQDNLPSPQETPLPLPPCNEYI